MYVTRRYWNENGSECHRELHEQILTLHMIMNISPLVIVYVI